MNNQRIKIKMKRSPKKKVSPQKSPFQNKQFKIKRKSYSNMDTYTRMQAQQIYHSAIKRNSQYSPKTNTIIKLKTITNPSRLSMVSNKSAKKQSYYSLPVIKFTGHDSSYESSIAVQNAIPLRLKLSPFIKSCDFKVKKDKNNQRPWRKPPISFTAKRRRKSYKSGLQKYIHQTSKYYPKVKPRDIFKEFSKQRTDRSDLTDLTGFTTITSIDKALILSRIDSGIYSKINLKQQFHIGNQQIGQQIQSYISNVYNDLNQKEVYFQKAKNLKNKRPRECTVYDRLRDIQKKEKLARHARLEKMKPLSVEKLTSKKFR